MSIVSRIAIPVSIFCMAMLPIAASAQGEPGATSVAAEYLGKMVYGPKGERLGAVYKVGQDGAAQVIISGKMVNIPASSLNVVEGKLTTSIDKRTLTTAR